MTNYDIPGSLLNDTELFIIVSNAKNSKLKMPTCQVPGEGSLPG